MEDLGTNVDTSSGVSAPVAASELNSVAAGSSDTRTSQRVVKLSIEGTVCSF